MAIDEHGCMWACGRNMCGQLGFSNNSSIFNMTRIPTDFLRCVFLGSAQLSSFLNHWSVQNEFILLVCKGQALYLAGPRSVQLLTLLGSCRRAAQSSNLSAVSLQGGQFHTAFLMNSGALYTCGKPANGRLGNRAVVLLAEAHGIGLENLPAISAPHRVEAFSSQTHMSLTHYVTYVTCGDAHTMAITLSGCLMAWGENEYGQLGVGDKYGTSSMNRGSMCIHHHCRACTLRCDTCSHKIFSRPAQLSVEAVQQVPMLCLQSRACATLRVAHLCVCP
jgi:hypothetical protein